MRIHLRNIIKIERFEKLVFNYSAGFGCVLRKLLAHALAPMKFNRK